MLPMKSELPLLLRPRFLSKLPAILLVLIFGLPIILIQIDYKVGLFFIALYISYWSIKVFESYYYVLRSYIELLGYGYRSFEDNEILLNGGKDIQHVVVIPVYTEPYEVIEENIEAIMEGDYPFMENITIVLATEERAEDGKEKSERIVKNWNGKRKIRIISIVHPANLPNEGKVKGANISYAVIEYEKMMKKEGIILDPHTTFVSTIDTDTKVEKKFFSIATFRFLTTPFRDQAIYQYTPVYSNNWTQ